MVSIIFYRYIHVCGSSFMVSIIFADTALRTDPVLWLPLIYRKISVCGLKHFTSLFSSDIIFEWFTNWCFFKYIYVSRAIVTTAFADAYLRTDQSYGYQCFHLHTHTHTHIYIYIYMCVRIKDYAYNYFNNK